MGGGERKELKGRGLPSLCLTSDYGPTLHYITIHYTICYVKSLSEEVSDMAERLAITELDDQNSTDLSRLTEKT